MLSAAVYFQHAHCGLFSTDSVNSVPAGTAVPAPDSSSRMNNGRLAGSVTRYNRALPDPDFVRQSPPICSISVAAENCALSVCARPFFSSKRRSRHLDIEHHLTRTDDQHGGRPETIERNVGCCANALGASFTVASRHFTPFTAFSAFQLLAECFAVSRHRKRARKLAKRYRTRRRLQSE